MEIAKPDGNKSVFHQKKINEYNRNAIFVRNEEISPCSFSINPLKKSSYTKEKINENSPNLMEMHIYHILIKTIIIINFIEEIQPILRTKIFTIDL